MATTALQGWHPGELAVQRKLGFADAVNDRWLRISNFLPEQHRKFHTSNLLFAPVTTIDEIGRPWASVVAGPSGDFGFVKSPDPTTLSISAGLWEGDPLLDTLKAWINLKHRLAARPERFLVAGLGIDFATRRRNKFAGFIRSVSTTTVSEYHFDLQVAEALGNCPKYINIRKLIPYPHTRPVIAHRQQNLTPHQRLPEEVIEFILKSDTVFVGSIYKSESSKSTMFPSHAGMNVRSGLPGFVRVSPSDGRTLILPDYSGNGFFSSLGNIEASGSVGLTIVSFTTGDILYMTGLAENLVGPSAVKIMARHTASTSMQVTAFVFVRDALPVRQQPGTTVERSPYSPNVKYLVEERENQASSAVQCRARLQDAVQISSDLAVFRFKVITKSGVSNLSVRPGQAIVLDFMDWIGPPQYQHMADSAPRSLNNDRVRTWTVSSAHESQYVSWFELTMREKKGGAVTGALFEMLRKHSSDESGRLDSFDNPVFADIVGTTGDFSLHHGKVNVLWVAGGIGITPFLAMLNALSERGSAAEGDIMLVLATRDAKAMLGLMRQSLEKISLAVHIRIDIFTHDEHIDVKDLEKLPQTISVHRDRIRPEYWADVPKDKEVFICGPNDFGDSVTTGLRAVGLPLGQIQREGFY